MSGAMEDVKESPKCVSTPPLKVSKTAIDTKSESHDAETNNVEAAASDLAGGNSFVASPGTCANLDNATANGGRETAEHAIGDLSIATALDLAEVVSNQLESSEPADSMPPSPLSSQSGVDELILVPVAKTHAETASSPGTELVDLEHDRQSPSLVTPSSTSEEPSSSREPSSSDSTTSSDCSPPVRSAASKGYQIEYADVTMSPPTASAQILSLQSSPPLLSTAAERVQQVVADQRQASRLAPLQQTSATLMSGDHLFDSESELDDIAIDSDDLKEYYTDCSDDTDVYFGLVQSPGNGLSNRSSVSPAPPSPPRAGGSGSARTGPAVSPAAPVPPRLLAQHVSVACSDDSPTRAGKRRAVSPPIAPSKRRRSRTIFAPGVIVLDRIVTELLLATLHGFPFLPTAVEARHGGENRGRYRFYQFLFECRALLGLQLISTDWYYAIQRNPLWLDIPTALVRFSIIRSLANTTVLKGYERIEPLGWFTLWLRERCLACLVNEVNLDVRGIKRGLHVLNHCLFGHIMLCTFHMQPAAEARRGGSKDVICHTCLMNGSRPEGGESDRAYIIPCGRAVECRGWRPNECGDCRADAFIQRYDVVENEIPGDYHDCYLETRPYQAWVKIGWGKTVERVLASVMEELSQMIQRDACNCRICERQKRLREEEADGAFGATGRNGAGADKRLKRC